MQATTSVSFYNIAPGLDVTLFGTLPDVASAAKVSGVLICYPHEVPSLLFLSLQAGGAVALQCTLTAP